MNPRRRIGVALLAAWLIGVGSGLGGVAVTGGWYEYHALYGSEDERRLINEAGWQPVPNLGGNLSVYILRRPRVRVEFP
jgi:hypothetical protein